MGKSGALGKEKYFQLFQGAFLVLIQGIQSWPNTPLKAVADF